MLYWRFFSVWPDKWLGSVFQFFKGSTFKVNSFVCREIIKQIVPLFIISLNLFTFHFPRQVCWFTGRKMELGFVVSWVCLYGIQMHDRIELIVFTTLLKQAIQILNLLEQGKFREQIFCSCFSSALNQK